MEVTLPANLIRKTFSFVDVMEMMLDCVAAHFSIPSGKLWKPANMKHISKSRPSTNGSLQRPRQKRTTFCLVYKWQWKRYHNQGHLLARYLKEKKITRSLLSTNESSKQNKIMIWSSNRENDLLLTQCLPRYCCIIWNGISRTWDRFSLKTIASYSICMILTSALVLRFYFLKKLV